MLLLDYIIPHFIFRQSQSLPYLDAIALSVSRIGYERTEREDFSSCKASESSTQGIRRVFVLERVLETIPVVTFFSTEVKSG